jgi:hypothetical protein
MGAFSVETRAWFVLSGGLSPTGMAVTVSFWKPLAT